LLRKLVGGIAASQNVLGADLEDDLLALAIGAFRFPSTLVPN